MKKVLLSAMLLVGGVAVMNAQSVKGSADTRQAKKTSVKPTKQVATTQQNAGPVVMVDAKAEKAKANARAKEEGKVGVQPMARKKN